MHRDFEVVDLRTAVALALEIGAREAGGSVRDVEGSPSGHELGMGCTQQLGSLDGELRD
ncbi:hypothetical protein [Streptomyces werraensis]|uniref:hypothetical protein n=1 Tax=Streptomyces werraensis TaxID=68284 RepID=UPI0036CD7D78